MEGGINISDYFNKKYSSIDDFRNTAEKVILIKMLKRRKMNMTMNDLWASFDDDVRELEEECEREGYPSRGSNFDLRYEQLVKLYHEREQYCSDYVEEEDE